MGRSQEKYSDLSKYSKVMSCHVTSSQVMEKIDRGVICLFDTLISVDMLIC